MYGKPFQILTNKILPEVPKRKNKKRNQTFLKQTTQSNIFKQQKQNAQFIIIDTLQYLFEQINQNIDDIGQKRFYLDIKSHINKLTESIQFLIYPQHQTSPICLSDPQKQPLKSLIDPIIGRDKNIISKKNKRTSSHMETSVKNLQQKSIKHIEISSKKLIKFNNNKQSKERSKSSVKFIPLQRHSSTLINDIRAEQFYRDRILKEIDHKNLLSNLSTKSNTLKVSLGGTIQGESKKQQYNYDYNGSKISLLKSTSLKNHCNIIKSLYKLSKEQQIELYGKEETNWIKFNSGKKEQEPTQVKLLNQMPSLQLSIKNRLENQMRKNKLQFKTVFAD